jgi:hypothetical protein
MISKHVLLLAGLVCCLGLGTNSSLAQTNNAAPDSGVAPPKAPAHRRIGRLGDPVPPITVREWIKGKPFRINSGAGNTDTNIYVLVFCKLTEATDFALTNLSALQRAYGDKGVVTAAICPEDPDALRTCVQLRGEYIDFTVAADDVPARTCKTYQQVFGQIMLPRAYIVRDGKLVWHGHPLTDNMGEIVDQLTSGHFDSVAVRRALLTREQLEEYIYLGRQNDPRTERIGQLFLRFHTNDAAVLCEFASKIATDPGLDQRDTALAGTALDRAAQLTTTNATDIAVIRAELLFQSGQQTEGVAKAREALASAQSPEAKDEVETVLKAMQMAVAAAQSQTNAPGTVGTKP